MIRTHFQHSERTSHTSTLSIQYMCVYASVIHANKYEQYIYHLIIHRPAKLQDN